MMAATRSRVDGGAFDDGILTDLHLPLIIALFLRAAAVRAATSTRAGIETAFWSVVVMPGRW
ncbi:hypothetical protein SAMN05443668_1221 [Cryptosporangium aurantiacum]|uniref:Uncharacterized protein n=1 Tax=Cryptosporangium aurantiacum TaxID=134849 RepID=A0A1M7RLS4_9ACTN|nr:hypothetical protein SAMN05443668_1221 [Cryptosporangium aurantiacum]